MISPNETAYPLTLIINDVDGGVTGLSPVVQIRQGANYLDFNDNVFKAAGWTTKQASLTELDPGIYKYDLDLSALTLTGIEYLVAEYFNGTTVAQERLLIDPIIDGMVRERTVHQRTNAYTKGKAELTNISPGVDDIEYFAENGTTGLYTNRRAATDRTPQ